MKGWKRSAYRINGRCHSAISLETKLRVYQASVLSVLFYGSECWPIFTNLFSRLSAFDMQAHRTITNTKWFDSKTNTEVRSHTKLQPRLNYSTSPLMVWSSTPVSVQSSCPRHLHRQVKPECAGMVNISWSPSHAMGRRPRQRPQTAGDNTAGCF